MKKSWYKSKTVIGALIAGISAFLTSGGWIPETLVTDLALYAGTLFGIYGLRDALTD